MSIFQLVSIPKYQSKRNTYCVISFEIQYEFTRILEICAFLICIVYDGKTELIYFSIKQYVLREKCLHSQLFWSLFCRIRT